MSVELEENSYKKLREYDSSWQSMTRMADINNIFDIKQRFVKNGVTNDFAIELEKFSNNKGYLSDGTFINKQIFFSVTNVGSQSKLTVTPVKYFKFKANFIMDYKNPTTINNTYINKTHYSSIYTLKETTTDGNISYSFGDKTIETETLSSYPLQRVDKLIDNELMSIFLYINGKKIPDNEIFIYPGKSWTDILIPISYIGNIESDSFYTDIQFNIDIRKPGTESFYYRNTSLSGSSLTINLADNIYSYSNFTRITQNITKDKVVMFVDGKLSSVSDVSYVDADKQYLKVNFSNPLSYDNVEIYVLNDIVHRYSIPETSMLNSNGSKVCFYINDDYITDTLCGPITKSSISFFYKGIRIDDYNITQTSRFSFEYNIDQYTYTIVGNSSTATPLSTVTYYEKLSNGIYTVADVSNGFDVNKIYYIRTINDTFDETQMDFFVEDINDLVNDSLFRLYGDDYYLLNMLGTKRCVDKMKGSPSYSIFDNPSYTIGFKDVLSKNGTQFDVDTIKKYYDNLEETYHSDGTRIEQLIKDKPSICRDFFHQFARPSKKTIVLGNDEDLIMSSVEKFDENALIYYKIYVNHMLLSTDKYSTQRTHGIDLITIPKSNFNALVKDINGNVTSGINRIELFQYDLTYSSKLVTHDIINNSFLSSVNETDGIRYYTKTYNLSDLPFGTDFLNDDIVAVEPVEKAWYTSKDDEYYLIYPNMNDLKGFRSVKSFKITNHTDTQVTIKIALHNYTDTNGKFLMLCKNFNVVKTITITNEDETYMQENDLVFPIYSSYVEYTTDELGNKIVSEILDYIPYENNSEPFLSKSGKELVYGKDYTYITPEKSDAIACSYLVMKSQMNTGDVITLQFNSAKTNILILGYTDLNIDNKYGLIYMSELTYPVDTEYMNIFVNGEKVSKMDVDILSDKLIRVHNIYRPIYSLVVTTNLLYKQSELSNFINCYESSEFEKLLAKIFLNCDPAYVKDSDRPVIDTVYKVDPTNLEVYPTNHGFETNVDSVSQAENPLQNIDSDDYNSDTMVIMYINWLCHSKKTRAYGFKAENINSTVLKYFSIYTNTVIDNRIDMVIDSSKFYNGVYPDIMSDPIHYDVDETTNKLIKTIQYPGAQIDLRRRFFYSIMLDVLGQTDSSERIGWNSVNKQDMLVKAMCDHAGGRILYPDDFPLEPDENGILWTGSTTDIIAN